MFFSIFALVRTFIIIPILIRVTFATIKLTLHSHNICFAYIFDPFILVRMFKTLKYKSPVSFEIYLNLLQMDNNIVVKYIHYDGN